MAPLRHPVILAYLRIRNAYSLQSIIDLKYIYNEVFALGCEEAVTWAVFARPLPVESAQVR